MILKGIGASKGIAIFKAFKFQTQNLDINTVIEGDQTEAFENAIKKTKEQLEQIKAIAVSKIAEEAAIFDAHILVLSDPELINGVKSLISEGCSAALALDSISRKFVSFFESMDNEYMSERAADIKDVSRRIMANLLGVDLIDLSSIDEEVIVIANDLTPSDTAQLNKEYVKGFITEIGGRTSHSAIMARSLEIPAIVGVKNILDDIKDGNLIILDAINGEVVINPPTDIVKEYEIRKENYQNKIEFLKEFKTKKTLTKCNQHIELAANIGSVDDLDKVLENGAEGIGLFRTEFIFMDRANAPTEDEQFEIYKSVLEKMNSKPVVVRTLDIGGDKELPYLDLGHELNPFLGYRAIRMCLDRTDIFKTQLRALLRASVYGNLKIMFPMIATVEEFLEAKEILLTVKTDLLEEKISVSDKIEIGMMIEIPAAAILSKQFAKHADFFSIGTNDLIQYSFAADRMNSNVSYLYQPFNPSLLNLIKIVVEGAKTNNRWVGMCGEMAGNTNATELLLGLGLTELSMSATSILEVRELISRVELDDAKRITDEVLNFSTQKEVLDYIKEKRNGNN
jgi:phosphotransferase system enzyme I (PtsI)